MSEATSQQRERRSLAVGPNEWPEWEAWLKWNVAHPLVENSRCLTRSSRPIFSKEDQDLSLISWGADRKGYAIRGSAYAHWIVCYRTYGFRPRLGSGKSIDHINRNKVDNRRENIRIVPLGINTSNAVRPTRPSNARLRLEEANQLREIYLQGDISMLALAHLYGIGETSVRRIIHNKSYIKP